MTETILQHKIDYFFRDAEGRELDEADIEHIEESIKQGYSQGELCQFEPKEEKEYRGWWKILRGDER